MKTTTRFLSGVAIATILSTSATASENFFDVGYTSATIDGVSQSGVSAGFGVNFGETIKQAIGLKVAFLGNGNDVNEDRGNLGDIYYNIGYEVLPNTIAYGSVGYGFQSLGNSSSSSSSSSSTSVYASGMSFGGGVQYNFTKNFALDVNYKNYALSYEALDYDAKVINAGLIYKFSK